MHGLRLKLVGLVVLLVGCAAAGLWLGKLSVRDALPATASRQGAQDKNGQTAEAEDGGYVDPQAPPVFFFMGADYQGDWSIAIEEVAMAAESGLHQYIVPVPLPWANPEQMDDTLGVIQRVIEADPQAAMLLQVDLNPSPMWFSEHPDARMDLPEDTRSIPCVVSPQWVGQARQALERLVRGIEGSAAAPQVLGYVLTALEEGRWYHPPKFDRSEANRQGFGHWLQRRYADDGALRTAWADDSVTFDTLEVPEQPDTAGTAAVFYALPEMQPVADFLEYTSEVTASTIAGLATHIKSISKNRAQVLAPYGYAYELTSNAAGHFALGFLLDSDLDGFVSPVSKVDRGLGGAGGMMGPVNSAQYHGKQWYIVDDTRTPVGRDPLTGKITRIKGLRAEDVYSVQRRNFALAAIQGLGLVWSDPLGEGWLHDPDQWVEFAKMAAIYRDLRAAAPDGKTDDRAPYEAPQLPLYGFEPMADDLLGTDVSGTRGADSGKLELGTDMFFEGEAIDEGEAVLMLEDSGQDVLEDLAEAEEEPPTAESPFFEQDDVVKTPFLPSPVTADFSAGLMVVVDESSRFFQRCDIKLNELLLQQGRDSALRVGTVTHFCLLQDILDERTPPTPVYLFLNAFHLPVRDRDRLHALLERERACAIWLYAPGYIGDKANTDNIAATVRMKVAAFDGLAQSGSIFRLAGRWMGQDERFGVPMDIAPLFHIDDPEADVLAQYGATEKTSVAVRVLPEGWTSVYIAEPAVTPNLLRELMRILEQHLYVRPAAGDYLDTIHVGENLIAVHGRKMGERAVALGRFYDVQDLFDPSIGWLQKESFMLPLKNGETRLLKLAPL